jgi:hypothetical protein
MKVADLNVETLDTPTHAPADAGLNPHINGKSS